jgi:hypothetical protein
MTQPLPFRGGVRGGAGSHRAPHSRRRPAPTPPLKGKGKGYATTTGTQRIYGSGEVAALAWRALAAFPVHGAALKDGPDEVLPASRRWSR